ncbi:peptide deformylase 1B, chloroplastic/mitochondrial [Malania oleifera]|uniref:peptide deformylase 1B, chloroplastic/mitochondrial n=1 Tax=Malania oleifera TaxID=397392 RepID=UPI0025AE565D|nr:peptide deformylase 1B, chloroplastic/mitochondrial [Malania oleifera]
MVCATFLYSPSFSRAPLHLLSTFPTQTTGLGRFLLLASTCHRSFSASRPRALPRMIHVDAQSKRGFSFKDDEVASPSDTCFQSPLKIVEYPDPILRAKNKRIDAFDDNLKKLVEEMFDVMYKTDGCGLSAPQVGINVQVMVFNPVGERGDGDEIVLINPRINKYSKKKVLFNEGCLSFPKIYADVERPESVKIDAQDISGARFTIKLSGLLARVFQHEFDHLQGILFCDRMTEEVLDGICADLQVLENKYEHKTGFPSPERIETRKRRKVAAGFGKS